MGSRPYHKLGKLGLKGVDVIIVVSDRVSIDLGYIEGILLSSKLGQFSNSSVRELLNPVC